MSGRKIVVGVTDIWITCGSPAPLAVNGGQLAECQLNPGHVGDHMVEIQWQ